MASPSVRRAHPAVSVEVELIAAPLGPCTIFPGGKPGVVSINGTAYSVGYIAHSAGDVNGYTIAKEGGEESYDLPASLATCECKDSLYRARPGGCRHAAALRALKAAGRIA